ncbi:TPA: hypothetical protein ACQZ3K_002923, partial [Listeria monocytogenes]
YILGISKLKANYFKVHPMEVKGLIGRSRKTAPFLLSLMTRARAPKTTIKLFLKMLQFCLSYSILA